MVSPERLESMQQGWVRLLASFGTSPVAAYPVFDILVAAYSSPERQYHNLEHLAEVFRVAARLGSITDENRALHLAIWFHDAVYDSRAADNEARSAALAVDLLGPLGVSAAVLERVQRLVLATAHHAAESAAADRETSILLDADLAILGAAQERYHRYAAAIRQEYAWVPDAEYRNGRARVLEGFLKRQRIFRTELLFQEGEAQARTNIRQELGHLAGT